jgi:hypothetical protein
MLKEPNFWTHELVDQISVKNAPSTKESELSHNINNKKNSGTGGTLAVVNFWIHERH